MAKEKNLTYGVLSFSFSVNMCSFLNVYSTEGDEGNCSPGSHINMSFVPLDRCSGKLNYRHFLTINPENYSTFRQTAENRPSRQPGCFFKNVQFLYMWLFNTLIPERDL